LVPAPAWALQLRGQRVSRIFITGSSEGLGRAEAEALQDGGHSVVVHVRSPERPAAVRDLLDGGAQAVVGDLAGSIRCATEQGPAGTHRR
jgi:NAD(P)-dependent dehydrogenase (short-subunit alcohol dehydrogenase family)